jgi:glycosyltransferase involved in cell wall biosynthesis
MSDRPHILIVNHNAGSVHHGPNFRSFYVARSLLGHGFRVTIACSSFSHKLTRLPLVSGRYGVEDVDGVRMIWIKTPSYRSAIGRLWNYACFARRLSVLDQAVPEPVAAVVCSSPPPYWIFFCRRFAGKKRAKLVFEARDLWPDVLLERFRTAVFNPAVWLMRVAEKLAYRSCDAAVAVNVEARAVMERRGLAPGKFRVIANGVVLDPEEVRVTLSPAVRERIPSAEFYVGYAGTLNEVCGLRYFIEAARLLCADGICFVLAGEGPAAPRLKRQAAGLANVAFVGWVSKRELTPFLAMMDVAFAGWLDLPSLGVGSDSTKIAEYMKARRPVIFATRAKTSIVRELGCGAHVKPGDPRAIANAVLGLRGLSAAERAAMGRAGREFVVRHRTYEVLGREWAELLHA